jgi:predicted nucleic acid-binding protein
MSFLLDTNAVSEWMKPKPNAGILTWLQQTDEDLLFLSVVTVAELRRGVERLPVGARRKRLEHWLEEDLVFRFEKRILPIDVAVADVAGKLIAKCESLGKPIEAVDAFIAATAQVHDLVLVTRNVSDFAVIRERILSPWL